MNKFGFLLSAGATLTTSEYIMAIFGLLCGLALFLYGMNTMGDALKRCAGSGLKSILGRMTTNPVSGFLLGLGVTAVIQSSSATTVMVVGFVNSGTMTLLQATGVIIGANVGTAVTAWITATNSLNSMSASMSWLEWLKPDSWMPILAVIGIALTMFAKRGRKKDVGFILLGFSVLMVGMSMMSESVEPLTAQDGFRDILLLFNSNPILGIIVGLVLTAIVQSSSASVGILQTMATSFSIGGLVPIIMGQNIGTCVTALLSSIGANKNGRRAALVHLYFNIIGVIIVSIIFYTLKALIAPFAAFLDEPGSGSALNVAIIHTLFKIICVAIIFPFHKLLVKLACLTVRDNGDEAEVTSLMDERLLDTPTVAVDRAAQVAGIMADMSGKSMIDAMSLFDNFDPKLCDGIRDVEGKVDNYEDSIGSYLVKVSACNLDQRDSEQVTKLLHIIGDYERISDHAVNIVESVEEIKDKKIVFSPDAQHELDVLRDAVGEILTVTNEAYINNDLGKAALIEPLEQVVDDLRDRIRLNHILRLQKSECTIEHGFVLSDLLTNFERVADHCSNIAGCLIEISAYDALDMHKYLASVKQGSEEFEQRYRAYSAKYSI